MLIDSLVSFVPPGTTLSMVAGAGVAIPSSVIDLLGLGVGVPATTLITGVTTTGAQAKFGEDPGIDWPRLQAQIMVSTALTTGSAATANFAYQVAEDDGTGNPDTWHTVIESGEIAVTDMDAIGDIPFQFDLTPAHPLNLRPRFLRVLMTPAAGTNFTAGAITIPTTTGLDQQRQFQTPKNYVVGAPA